MIAQVVEKRIAEVMADKESLDFRPFFEPREVAWELRRRMTVQENRKWNYYFEEWGCLGPRSSWTSPGSPRCANKGDPWREIARTMECSAKTARRALQKVGQKCQSRVFAPRENQNRTPKETPGLNKSAERLAEASSYIYAGAFVRSCGSRTKQVLPRFCGKVALVPRASLAIATIGQLSPPL
jgi:hypothetical protein